MPSAVFRLSQQRQGILMPLLGGLVLGATLGALGGMLLSSGGPDPETTRRQQLVQSALVEALREHHAQAMRLIAEAASAQSGDDMEALRLLIEKAELVHTARQAELKGKSDAAFGIYQKALKIDELPVVRRFIEQLEAKSKDGAAAPSTP